MEMFHVAARSERKQIERFGLDYRYQADKARDYPAGNYLWLREADAHWYMGLLPAASDIWAVDTDGLELAEDPAPFVTGAVYTTTPVTASRLRRIL